MTNIRIRVLPAILPADGREIELQATATHIQWRYVTDISGEYEWADLVALSELIGPTGPSIELRSDGTNIQYRAVGDVDWTNLIPLADLTGPSGEAGPTGPEGPAGPGDVDGPASAVAERIATFDGTTGKLIKDGGKTIAEISGNVVGPASATDSGLAAFDGTTGKLLKSPTPLNARLAAELFADYHIAGLKPDKISTDVLRLYPGVVYGSDGQLVARSTANYDINMATTGVGGLDTGSPVNNTGYFVYVLRNNTTGAFAAVISASITYGGVTLPSGYTHVRKLRFGFVYNSTRGGIPDHDAANWPWPMIRLTGAEGGSLWRALNAGTATSNTAVACANWIPDNCRLAMLMVTVTCGASAGTGYITASGAGHTNGIEFSGIPNSTYTTYVPAIRVSSTLELLYKVSGGVSLSIFILGYYATEPS